MNNQPKADQSKTRRNLIVASVIFIMVLGAGGFYLWSQKKAELTRNNAEKQVEQAVRQGEDQEQKNVEGEKRKGDGQISKNLIKKVRLELWSQLKLEGLTNDKNIDSFVIEKVNDSQTIALGVYNVGTHGGANIFAFRNSVNGRWNIKITQEALSCDDRNKLTINQIVFIKNQGIKYCVIFDEKGFMHREKL